MGTDRDIRREVHGVEEFKDSLLAAHAIGWISQEDLPCGTTLVDAYNRFNMVNLRGNALDGVPPLAGGGEACLQLLQALGVTGRDPVIILSRHGVTQGDPSLWYYWYYTRPPSGLTFRSIARLAGNNICRQYLIKWSGRQEIKPSDTPPGAGAGPGILLRAD